MYDSSGRAIVIQVRNKQVEVVENPIGVLSNNPGYLQDHYAVRLRSGVVVGAGCMQQSQRPPRLLLMRNESALSAERRSTASMPRTTAISWTRTTTSSWAR